MTTCFVKPELAQGVKASPEVTVGLVSNDLFLSLGLALAKSPLEDFIQFDKNSIGKLAISDSICN